LCSQLNYNKLKAPRTLSVSHVCPGFAEIVK
jgi:hypothetical protein